MSVNLSGEILDVFDKALVLSTVNSIVVFKKSSSRNKIVNRNAESGSNLVCLISTGKIAVLAAGLVRAIVDTNSFKELKKRNIFLLAKLFYSVIEIHTSIIVKTKRIIQYFFIKFILMKVLYNAII